MTHTIRAAGFPLVLRSSQELATPGQPWLRQQGDYGLPAHQDAIPALIVSALADRVCFQGDDGEGDLA
jgi:hypothetical protein